jgi:hypothetical protein
VELISWFEYRIAIFAIFSGLISVIFVYFGKIFIGDVFVNFDYVLDFRFVFLIAIICFVRTRVFFNIFIFTANKQESRFRLRKRRKIFIFNYLQIWSVRVLLNLIIIIIRCGPIFVILIFLFIQLYILIIIRFTDRFLFAVIKKLPININFGSDITFTLYLLNKFIFNNISIGFGNMQT